MLLATWNLNNRVGKVRFRPEAARAIVALGADVVVLTEYYPRAHRGAFESALAESGWPHQLLSFDPTERANRVLIASRMAIERHDLALPDFDQVFGPNVLIARIPAFGLELVGVRIPYYDGPERHLVLKSWAWLEDTASALVDSRAVIIGDLNAEPKSPPRHGGASLRRILGGGWSRAAPTEGFSYFGRSSRSELDHVLATARCRVTGARYTSEIGEFVLAGRPGALSDHAALVAEVVVS